MKTKALLILLALALSCALAQPANPMRFKVDRACDGNADMCAPRIYGEGIIQPDTAKTFAAFTRTNRQKLPSSPLSPFRLIRRAGASLAECSWVEKIADWDSIPIFSPIRHAHQPAHWHSSEACSARLRATQSTVFINFHHPKTALATARHK